MDKLNKYIERELSLCTSITRNPSIASPCMESPRALTRSGTGYPNGTHPITKKPNSLRRIVAEGTLSRPSPLHTHISSICLNNLCISPAHLKWLTKEERYAHVVSSQPHALPPSVIADIRENSHLPTTYFSIKYNIPLPSVESILSNKTYKHLPLTPNPKVRKFLYPITPHILSLLQDPSLTVQDISLHTLLPELYLHQVRAYILTNT